MDWFQIALRILHIGSGILWVGGAAFFFFYIEPTLNKLGPKSQPFVEEIVNKKKMPIYFAVAGAITVLAGATMYWRDSAGLSNAWTTSATGLVFGFGGILAIIAWAAGGMFLSPAVRAVGSIGGEMQAAGGPPSTELMARMQAAQERVRMVGGIDLALIVVAAIAMSTARYLG
jgi:uncharacterized membrane protein